MLRTFARLVLVIAMSGMANKAIAENPGRRPINPQTRGAGTGQSRIPTNPQTRGAGTGQSRSGGLLTNLLTAPLRLLRGTSAVSSSTLARSQPQNHQFTNRMDGHTRAEPTFRNTMSGGFRR